MIDLLEYIDKNNDVINQFFNEPIEKVIYVPTTDLLDIICKIFNKTGETLSSGSSYNLKYLQDKYPGKLCLSNTNHYGDKPHYISYGYEIIEAKDFINKCFVWAILKQDCIIIDLGNENAKKFLLNLVKEYPIDWTKYKCPDELVEQFQYFVKRNAEASFFTNSLNGRKIDEYKKFKLL